MYGGVNIEILLVLVVNRSLFDFVFNVIFFMVDNNFVMFKVDMYLEDVMQDEDESDIEDVVKLFGVLKVDLMKSKYIYFGEEYWYIILFDIIEVKNYFVFYRKELENSYEQVKCSKFFMVMVLFVLLMGVILVIEVEF